MKNLFIDALSVNIDPNKDYSVQLDINMEDAEYESILSQYGAKNIVRISGAEDLLEAMDVDEIRQYLDGIGIKTEWEDEQ